MYCVFECVWREQYLYCKNISRQFSWSFGRNFSENSSYLTAYASWMCHRIWIISFFFGFKQLCISIFGQHRYILTIKRASIHRLASIYMFLHLSDFPMWAAVFENTAVTCPDDFTFFFRGIARGIPRFVLSERPIAAGCVVGCNVLSHVKWNQFISSYPKISDACHRVEGRHLF